MKYRLILFLIAISLGFLTPAYAQNHSDQDNVQYASGIVQSIVSETQNKTLQESLGGNQILQLVKVKILNGKYKGKIVKVENQLTSNPAYDIKVKPGSRVVLDIEKHENNLDINISDRERVPALMILAGLFASLLLIIGGMKGLKSLTSLLVTSLLVFFILVPAILNKFPIIPVTVAVAFISTLFSMFLIGGLNLKSVAACIGTIGGVTSAGLISSLIILIAPLSGLHDQESIILWSSRPDLNFTGLLTSAMIIGALGAIMDVGISIASSVAEVKSIDNSLTVKQLISSGLNVGRDIMGAMSNTLILAYIGSFLPLILLAADAPLVKLVNLNSIATEITAAVGGSIGIILSVPITAVVAGYLMGKKSGITDSIRDYAEQNKE